MVYPFSMSGLLLEENRQPAFPASDVPASGIDRERRAQFARALRESHEHYVKTGRHVSEAEADAWMAQLEAGMVVPPPACHT